MNEFDTCVNPSSDDYNSVPALKKCFNNGYKLASLQRTSMLENESIPEEWEIMHLDERTILLFPHRYIARMYRSTCDRYDLNYHLNITPSVKGEIINGLFFGYCIFDIAQYAFLRENHTIDILLKNVITKFQKGRLTEEYLTKVVKEGTFQKRERDLKTVFDYILEISTSLYNDIQLKRQYFDMNSTAVRNIRIGTLFHGSCTYQSPKLRDTWSTDTIFSEPSKKYRKIDL